jgi:hypothetical protein
MADGTKRKQHAAAGSSNNAFKALGLSESILKGVGRLGFKVRQ